VLHNVEKKMKIMSYWCSAEHLEYAHFVWYCCAVLVVCSLVFQVPSALISQIRQKREDSSSTNPVIISFTCY